MMVWSLLTIVPAWPKRRSLLVSPRQRGLPPLIPSITVNSCYASATHSTPCGYLRCQMLVGSTAPCYAHTMKDDKKVAAGKKGGFVRWARVSKRQRKKIMTAVARARYKKV